MTRAMLLTQKSGVPGSPMTDQASRGSATPLSHAISQGPSNNGTSTSVPTLSSTHSQSQSQSATPNPFASASNIVTSAGAHGLPLGSQDEALASESNIFDELKTTRSSSWQFELRQMERQNRLLAEELQNLISRKKKRKRRKGMGQLEKDCANCHTRVTPEWRRGPSGQRDLCNSCGLRWAKQNGRVSPRKYAQSDKSSTSPAYQPVASGSGAGTKDPNQSQSQSQNQNQNQSNANATPRADDQSGDGDAAKPSNDSDDTIPGNMPPKIDEGEEPPHPTVLPT